VARIGHDVEKELLCVRTYTQFAFALMPHITVGLRENAQPPAAQVGPGLKIGDPTMGVNVDGPCRAGPSIMFLMID